jgi:subtilisin family serine protease
MTPLALINLTPLMALTGGKVETKVALIDGPVAADHPDLASQNIRALTGKSGGACALTNSAACVHGTFVAGILCARRGSAAPAICPDCTLLVRPIFAESPSGGGRMPSATPEDLAAAIVECVGAGARVINLSVNLTQPSSKAERQLEEALNHAAERGAIVVAAAGNQGTLGSSALTRHPWAIPVVACDERGGPIDMSNLGGSIGRRGLSAPGLNITSLGTDGKPLTLGGTSIAAPFVTGSIALLWSEFPSATTAQVKLAVVQANLQRRATVVPPVLDAWAAYQAMKAGLRG